MIAKVQKWGNSLALRIPRAFAVNAQLANDSLVEINLEDGRLIITPVVAPRWTLEQLLAGINESNLHAEIETGEALGNEAW